MIAALAHVYPDLDRVIREHTNEEGRAVLDALEKMTTVEAVLRMAGKNMGDYLDEPLEDILSTPEVTHVFDSIKLGAAVPTPPVLIVQAVHDYLIDVHDIDELADAYSAGGARVTYHRDAFNEHMILHPLSAPMTLALAHGPVRGSTADRAPDQDHVADDVQPDDLRRHGATGQDRGQGHHRPEDSPPSAMRWRLPGPPAPSAAHQTVDRPPEGPQIVACVRGRKHGVHQRGDAGGPQQGHRDLQRLVARRTPAAPE